MEKKLRDAVAHFTKEWKPEQYEPITTSQTEIDQQFADDLRALIRAAKQEVRDSAPAAFPRYTQQK